MSLSASDVAAIRTAEQALAESFEAADPAAWVDFYTEDAILGAPGVPTIQGRAALVEAADDVVISSMQITADSTLGMGDLASTFGRATWVAGRKDSDAPVVRRRFLMVWRKDGGQWLIARELLNDEP
jgi:ketosteroid isomerase-like protein